MLMALTSAMGYSITSSQIVLGYREKRLFPIYEASPLEFPEYRMPILVCAISVLVFCALSLILRRETVILNRLHLTPGGLRGFAAFLSLLLGVFLVVVSFVTIHAGLRSHSPSLFGSVDLYLYDRGLLPYGIVSLAIAVLLAVSASSWREPKGHSLGQGE
jgi:hypothetical protein